MYTELDASQAEVRLLSVVPCREYNAKVSCRITITPLQSSPPRYAALSYVWGNAAETEEIVVNDEPFQATKSLASALRQFRTSYTSDDDASLLLWADAICINQQDLAERARQVSMMGTIYSKASCVISWLGTSDISTEVSFSLIKACAGHVKSAAEELGDYHKPNVPFAHADLEFLGQDSKFYEKNSERFARNEAWNAIDNLSGHTYWTRIWVIQELVLAQRSDAIIIHCGSEFVTFQQLSNFNLFTERLLKQKPQKPSFFNQRVWDWIVHDQDLLLSSIYFMATLREASLRDGGYSCVTTISMFCSSTDPRDAVFGLAGLIDGDVVPDYTKEPVDVYKDLVAAILRQKKYRIFFCHAGLISDSRDVSEFPSWVPRLHMLRDDSKYTILPPEAFVSTRIDHLHPEGPKIIDDNRMRFVGVRLDRCTTVIRYTGEADPGLDDFMETFWWTCLEFLKAWDAEHDRDHIRPLARLLTAFAKGRDTQQRPLQITPSLECMPAHAFRLMVRAGEPEDNELSKERYGKFGYTSLEEARWALDDAFVGPGAPDISTFHEVLTPAENEEAYNAYNQMTRTLLQLAQRPPFVTSTGRVGLAPLAVANGDLVCLLEGFPLPCLLRPMGQDYVLVGSCYVNGYSDGEPLRCLEKGTLMLEEFNIR